MVLGESSKVEVIFGVNTAGHIDVEVDELQEFPLHFVPVFVIGKYNFVKNVKGQPAKLFVLVINLLLFALSC